MSTKNVLPKNPFSIGPMISLLADFNLFEKEALTIRKWVIERRVLLRRYQVLA